MPKSLIIVESPAKTKTIKGFLGKDFAVEASMGHVMDLPTKGIAVDIERDFQPTYEVTKDRKDVVARLRAAAKGVDMVYLASDPDREGEAISAHIKEALGLRDDQYRRIQFNSLTRSAVEEGLRHPRTIDVDKYDAQQARRVLDRLVGYKISPLLWKKVRPGLSAGRVQSVAVRLVCDREREIRAFVPVESWSLTATLAPRPGAPGHPFDARLELESAKKIELKVQADADRVLAALEGADWNVSGIRKSERKRSAYAPFETATLQQEAARKLGFSSRRTMTVAQQLYEGIDLGGETGTTGLITYMRTDSTRIAPEAQAAAREHIRTQYGERYVPEKPNFYKSKGAAQEAHEAIRPTEVGWLPDAIKARLTADQHKLYKLIWLRFLSSQMSPAIFDAVSVDIDAAGFTFRATGSTVRFDGFLRIYNEGKDNPDQVDDDERPPLPPLVEGQGLDLVTLVPKQHFSEPPPRYTEATMVKTLKEKEIGRPSTYASILSTIVARQYVELKERKFHPTDLGFAVTDLLVEAFPTILDVQFTAEMERSLDEVEEGRRNWVALMRDFWDPLSRSIESAQERSFVKATGEQCPECGGDLVEKFGRFGKFQSCSNYPNCKYIKRDRPAEGEAAEPVVSDIPCPQCGKLLVEKSGRFGKFLGCPGYPDCKYIHKAPAKTTGITCPDCGKAEIVEKRSRTGVFYGCAGYPKCKLTLSGMPLGRPCPKCGGLLHEKAFRGRVSGIVCVNAKKGCDHTEKVAAGPAGDETEG